MGQTCKIGAGAPPEKLGLPTMACMKGLHPKGNLFQVSGIQKWWGFHSLQCIKWEGSKPRWSVKSSKMANR